MIKVSIIVPVYNVEKYLEKCLKSLVNQTLKDIEIIVVNDGATDNSQDIIDKFDLKYDNIIALKKTNGGLSDARNYGVGFAKGKYIGFVDSDDFVDEDMYENLYNKAILDKSDIVECNLRHTFEDFEDIEIGEKIYEKNKILIYGRSVVWNKIYDREWLTKTGVQFPKGLIYEDVQYYLMLVPYIRKYSYIDSASIHYVQRSSSINNFSTLKTMDILKILKNILEYYKKNGFYDEYKKALEFFFAKIILCSSFSRMTKIKNKKERKYALRENWEFLNDKFPDWKKSQYLKRDKSKNGIYMRTVNKFTYKIYSSVFPFLFSIKNKKRLKNG